MRLLFFHFIICKIMPEKRVVMCYFTVGTCSEKRILGEFHPRVNITTEHAAQT